MKKLLESLTTIESMDDSWDSDESLDKPEDPEKDKYPNLLMQMKKSMDVDGNYAIKFKDGTSHKLAIDDIVTFVDYSMNLMPEDTAKIISQGAESKEYFDTLVLQMKNENEKRYMAKRRPKSIYEKEGDDDEEVASKDSGPFYVYKSNSDNDVSSREHINDKTNMPLEFSSRQSARSAVRKMASGSSNGERFFITKRKLPEKKSSQVMTEAQFDESAGEKDACYHKVKSRYKVWPSAYASGALVQCRKAGASNWGNKGKKD